MYKLANTRPANAAVEWPEGKAWRELATIFLSGFEQIRALK